MAAYDAKAQTAFSGYDVPEATNTQSSIRRLYLRAAGWYQERQTYYRTLRELNYLSDRELADIGIARADIPSIARGSVRPRRAHH
jgi:uncharacterized protein YjiS (DUF1127 family)